MSNFDRKNSMRRFRGFAWLMALLAIAVVLKTLYIMAAKRDFWMQVADRVKVDNKPIPPVRGNILSCNGQLLASSLPQYKIFMDFRALHAAGNDSVWSVKLDSVCDGLSRIFPEKTPQYFRTLLNEGREKNSAHWAIWPRRINYSTYSEVRKLPVFRLGKNASGFHCEEFNARKQAYGSLAERTIGKMFGAKDTAQCGLELAYDSVLRGTEGIKHRRKVLNRYLDLTDTPPEDGADIVTTIDVDMQDLAERALLNELHKINANVGVAIVMEVATGDIWK